MMNIGTLIAHSLIIWVQDYVGWIWGFGIPTLAMAVGVVSFFSGTWFYRNHKPMGSQLTRLFQVVVASVRKRRVNVPTYALLLYEIADANSTTVRSQKLNHTSNFRSVLASNKGGKMAGLDGWVTGQNSMLAPGW
ncbi:putative bacterial ABC-type protein transporter [Helianthus anomalus]